MANPDPGLFSFFAPTTAGGGTNYPALEARRKIALAMMLQGGKKGYPKTLGEGLAAIGDAIGEKGAYENLMKQEAAYQKQLEEAPAPIPGALDKSVSPRAELSDGGGDTADRAVATVDQPVIERAVAMRPSEPVVAAAPSGPQDRYTENVDMPSANAVISDPALEGGRTVGTIIPTRQNVAAAYMNPVAASGLAVGSVNQAMGQPAVAGPASFASRFGAAPDTGALADAGDNARLADVVGLEKGPTGSYAYPRTASRGDITSDVPDVGITGISDKTGAAAADTLMQGRDTLAKALLLRQQQMQPPVQGVPQPNPTLAGALPQLPTSSTTPSPAPLSPNIQLAQATNPAVANDIRTAPPLVPKAPLTDLPQRPTPPPVVTKPGTAPPLPQDVPLSQEERLGYEMRNRYPGDPIMEQRAAGLIAYGAGQRNQAYQARLREYESNRALYNQQEEAKAAFERAAPERELSRKAQEATIAKATAFGGIDQEQLFKPIEKSVEQVKTIPMAQTAIRNARQAAVDGKMFTGGAAEIDLSLSKMLGAAGFPVNPKVPATEEFRAYIKPILAAARQALVGGANISDSDIKIAEAAVGGDIKLQRESIVSILGSLERMNTAMAVEHQRKLETLAGDDPQRQAAMRVYSLPMENIVPRGAIGILRQNPTPEIIDQFNRKYHSPGLAQSILGGG